MEDHKEQINDLLEKLALLQKKQAQFSEEIEMLEAGISKLAAGQEQKTGVTPETQAQEPAKAKGEIKNRQNEEAKVTSASEAYNKPPSQRKSNLEKFIGENLINKIGIAITVIGVAIGAKYAIDNQLISPVTRIILGYFAGAILFGFAWRLKQKFKNYSAVLISGSMATCYFITYFAYSYYNLFPQVAAFLLMLVITVATVYFSLSYNRQVIAHIGLVGAYAVPFLLSEGSDRALFLFSYVTIINAGILVVSFRKYWKPLYYASFMITWLIYTAWHNANYQADENLSLALTFLIVFFGTFYVTFLAYKLIHAEEFRFDDIILLLANSFVFYGIGYTTLDSHQAGQHMLGLFTLFNALIHFGVATIIHLKKLADRNLYYLVTGLVLVFFTISIPVQLDGNWVTLLWVTEAALLFWIGRTKNTPVYEWIAYPLMYLAFFSIVHDWNVNYGHYNTHQPEIRITPILNIHFLSSLLFVAAFGFINVINRHKASLSPLDKNNLLLKMISYSVPAIFLFTTYWAFRIEIVNYWGQLFEDSRIKITNNMITHTISNSDHGHYKTVWITNYSLLFFSGLAFFNIKRIKDHLLGVITLGFGTLALLVFLTQGQLALSALRESYLSQTLAHYYDRSAFNLVSRYVSFALVGLLLTAFYQVLKSPFNQFKQPVLFDLLLHTTILWIASSELLNWFAIGDVGHSYKYGLSILWGLYSLFLVVMGIWKKKKHLRIAAISWFGVTLLKLFFYDISDLDTIAKTIVFVSLGTLLLVISFLYHKYKKVIFEDTKR